MIPWFIAHTIAWVAERFGYDCTVRARCGAWGCDALYLHYAPDAVHLPRLKPLKRP